jgi:hypothetical protein
MEAGLTEDMITVATTMERYALWLIMGAQTTLARARKENLHFTGATIDSLSTLQYYPLSMAY